MTFGYSSMPVPPLDYLPITELHRQSSCIHPPCMRKYANIWIIMIVAYESANNEILTLLMVVLYAVGAPANSVSLNSVLAASYDIILCTICF